MASRDERLVENQRIFRAANERLEKLVSRIEIPDDSMIPFLCECADDGCLGRIEATSDEYANAHSDADQYFILPGHPRIEGEELIASNGRFELVQKTGV